ncbi:hypothetical protein PRO82_001104 [Candidatus Protochlamydia amoebophila]|nr:hypothetical protein [Candidatus Protochlamydia amoebophila]
MSYIKTYAQLKKEYEKAPDGNILMLKTKEILAQMIVTLFNFLKN